MTYSRKKKKLSIDIITSALNEEECLPEFFRRIKHIMSTEFNYKYRIIVIDNCSQDRTWEIIQDYSKKNREIFGIQLSKTFSLDAAFTCGLDFATGDIAIIMTSDLQDPPEQIPNLLRKYEEGFEQVLVKVIRRRSVPILRRIFSWGFYKIASKMTDGLLPQNVSDFRLMNRKSYLGVRMVRENHRFMRGISSWVGFKSTVIESERPERFAGNSKWLSMSIFRIFGQASRSIFAYSARPLMWLSTIGIISSLFSVILMMVLVIYWVLGGSRPFPGFGTLIIVGSSAFSLIMMSFGILAQYLSLTYEEVKRRPLYIVARTTSKSYKFIRS